MPGAIGRVKSVTYGMFQTIIEVEWESNDKYWEYLSNIPSRTYYQKIVTNEYSEVVVLGPKDSDETHFSKNYVIAKKLSPTETIKFIEYSYEDGKMTDNKINKVLCEIE